MANVSAPAPVRAIGWRSLTAICINGMIGAGILILPANIAQLLGGKSLYGYMLAGAAAPAALISMRARRSAAL